MFGQKNRDASIPVVVPIIISILMVPMMRAVPSVPPIFVRVSIVAVSVVTIVIGPDLLVTRLNANAESSSALDSVDAIATSPSAANPRSKYLLI